MPFVYGDTVGATNRDLFIDSTGKLGYVSSVRASKTNITELGSVSWLNQLAPVTFNYRKKDEYENYTDEPHEEKQYGLIAEEVEAVAPELCFYDFTDGEPELRGVHYHKLIAPLIQAVQELSRKNAALEARITALEA